MEKLLKFKELGLSDEILRALSKKGFEEPSKIQKLTIPVFFSTNKDIIGQAQTGTGKTAAFGLPIIDSISPKQGKVQALIMTPTRELAIQVSEELNSFTNRRKFSILPIYGGQSIENQVNRLKRGVDIVVGTPGRIIDHLNRKTLNLEEVSYVVLDEADEMLNMGFIEDIETILSQTSKNKRVMLFSATMPNRIKKLAESYMNEYENVIVPSKQLTIDLTDQIYFEVKESDRFEALCRIIDFEDDFYALVFCRTKNNVDEVNQKLLDRGYECAALHGDISQFQRERILNMFKNRRVNILVATDVAARGIDINDLTHVINYSLPQDPESYVHRIGRTGRAGKQGTAITFVTPSEYYKLMQIQRVTQTEIRKEKLPKVNELIVAKKNRFLNEIEEIITKGDCQQNADLAEELINSFNPTDVVSALITHIYENEFHPDNYHEIYEPTRRRSSTPDQNGKTRLFVAKGRKDKCTPKSLVSMIVEKTRIEANSIKNISVYDNFSFIEVPFRDAELIIKAFRKEGRDNKPLVVKAKEKK